MTLRYWFLTLVCIVVAACASKPDVRGLDAELSKYEYPFPVKEFRFRGQEQNLKMAYMDVADPDADKTIVLFHGKNFSGEYFEDIARRLLKKKYRVIMIDQVGFGKSTKPEHFQFTFQTLALYSVNLLDSIGVNKFQILGHSMGGMLATRVALMFPDRVTKLFLVNPIGLEDWKTMTSYRGIDQVFQSELENSPERLTKYQLENYYDNQWKSEYDKYLRIPVGWLSGPDARLIAWNSALTFDMIFTQPVYYEFRLLKMPTVLVIGTRDKTALGKAWAPAEVKPKMGDYLKMGRDVSKLIPQGKLVLIQGLGHLPFIEAPDLFWKTLEAEF